MARARRRSVRSAKKASGRAGARSGGGLPWVPVALVAALLSGGYLMTRKPAADGGPVASSAAATAEAPQPSVAAAPRALEQPATASQPAVTPPPVAPPPPAQPPAADSLRSTPVAAVAPAAPVATIGLAEAKAAFDSGAAMFVDARPSNGFVFGHVPGAVNLSAAQFEEAFAAKGPSLSRELRLVVYAADANAPEVAQVAAELGKRGFTKVVSLPDGWNAWAAAGHPKERGFGAAR